MNPFFESWSTPFELPPFDAIEEAHYAPAIERGLAALEADVAAITHTAETPTFANTILALRQAGAALQRVMRVFHNVTNTDTTPALQALEVEISPRLTRAYDAIYLDDVLYERVRAVYEERDALGLDDEDARLLELVHRDFVRAGAALGADAKARLKAINARVAELTTRFAQNLLAETKAFELLITDEADLAGLPPDVVRAARADARDAGHPDAWRFGLDRSSFEAFMTYSDRRDLRRVLFDGYRERGAHEGPRDNRPLVLEVVRLRAERAALLGYATHADYVLETTMAKSPAAAEAFLRAVWTPALARAEAETAAMQAIVDEEGGGFRIEAWDRWYYAEKLRRRTYAFDEAALKPYLRLEDVRAGAFHAAHELFGLTFDALDDVPTWHPDVEAFAVHEHDGTFLGVFLVDAFARPSKRGGAWMSTYRPAEEVDGRAVRPLVTNNLNLTKPAEGEATLLGFDEVETLFHEFGHALHALMTRVRHDRFSGTSGSPRDYVEFPSQFMEHYAAAPEVLAVYARHYETGEPLPQDLVDRLRAARQHHQGFKTTEYIAAALVDLAWHALTKDEADAVDEVRAFEREVLGRYGLPATIEPRYRSPYFAHLFASAGGYAAGYYAYLWSAVLDADGFAAFEAAGDPFDPALATRLAEHVYRAGYRAPGDVLYRRFRGADPSIEPLLHLRGLAGDA